MYLNVRADGDHCSKYVHNLPEMAFIGMKERMLLLLLLLKSLFARKRFSFFLPR